MKKIFLFKFHYIEIYLQKLIYLDETNFIYIYYHIAMSGFLDKLKQKLINDKKKAMIKALRDGQVKNGYSGVRSQNIRTSGETVQFTTKVDSLKKSVKDDVTRLNKEFNLSVENMLKYIEENGTKVYKIYNAEAMLNKVLEHTGFITPLEGPKAMYISTLVGLGLNNSNTDGMFIVSADKEADYYMLLREFYLWYSFKNNLAGFEFKTQEIFKKYMAEKRNPGMAKMKYDDMANLKEALARDSEANEFVMEFVRNKEGGANVLKKMQEGGADI